MAQESAREHVIEMGVQFKFWLLTCHFVRVSPSRTKRERKQNHIKHTSHPSETKIALGSRSLSEVAAMPEAHQILREALMKLFLGILAAP